MPLGGTRKRKTDDGQEFVEMRFTVPYVFHGPMGPVRSPDGPGNHGSVRIPKWDLVIRDEHWESRAKVVKELLKDNVLRSNPADAVVTGIMTLKEVQDMGFLHEAAELEALTERMGDEQSPPDLSEPVPDNITPLHSVPALPTFGTMSRKECIEWANSEGPEADALRGGQPPLLVNPMYSKDRVVDFIERKLKERGDPRVS